MNHPEISAIKSLSSSLSMELSIDHPHSETEKTDSDCITIDLAVDTTPGCPQDETKSLSPGMRQNSFWNTVSDDPSCKSEVKADLWPPGQIIKSLIPGSDTKGQQGSDMDTVLQVEGEDYNSVSRYGLDLRSVVAYLTLTNHQPSCAARFQKIVSERRRILNSELDARSLYSALQSAVNVVQQSLAQETIGCDMNTRWMLIYCCCQTYENSFSSTQSTVFDNMVLSHTLVTSHHLSDLQSKHLLTDFEDYSGTERRLTLPKEPVLGQSADGVSSWLSTIFFPWLFDMIVKSTCWDKPDRSGSTIEFPLLEECTEDKFKWRAPIMGYVCPELHNSELDTSKTASNGRLIRDIETNPGHCADCKTDSGSSSSSQRTRDEVQLRLKSQSLTEKPITKKSKALANKLVRSVGRKISQNRLRRHASAESILLETSAKETAKLHQQVFDDSQLHLYKEIIEKSPDIKAESSFESLLKITSDNESISHPLHESCKKEIQRNRIVDQTKFPHLGTTCTCKSFPVFVGLHQKQRSNEHVYSFTSSTGDYSSDSLPPRKRYQQQYIPAYYSQHVTECDNPQMLNNSQEDPNICFTGSHSPDNCHKMCCIEANLKASMKNTEMSHTVNPLKTKPSVLENKTVLYDEVMNSRLKDTHAEACMVTAKKIPLVTGNQATDFFFNNDNADTGGSPTSFKQWVISLSATEESDVIELKKERQISSVKELNKTYIITCNDSDMGQETDSLYNCKQSSPAKPESQRELMRTDPDGHSFCAKLQTMAGVAPAVQTATSCTVSKPSNMAFAVKTATASCILSKHSKTAVANGVAIQNVTTSCTLSKPSNMADAVHTAISSCAVCKPSNMADAVETAITSCAVSKPSNMAVAVQTANTSCAVSKPNNMAVDTAVAVQTSTTSKPCNEETRALLPLAKNTPNMSMVTPVKVKKQPSTNYKTQIATPLFMPHHSADLVSLPDQHAHIVSLSTVVQPNHSVTSSKPGKYLTECPNSLLSQSLTLNHQSFPQNYIYHHTSQHQQPAPDTEEAFSHKQWSHPQAESTRLELFGNFKYFSSSQCQPANDNIGVGQNNYSHQGTGSVYPLVGACSTQIQNQLIRSNHIGTQLSCYSPEVNGLIHNTLLFTPNSKLGHTEKVTSMKHVRFQLPPDEQYRRSCLSLYASVPFQQTSIFQQQASSSGSYSTQPAASVAPNCPHAQDMPYETAHNHTIFHSQLTASKNCERAQDLQIAQSSPMSFSTFPPESTNMIGFGATTHTPVTTGAKQVSMSVCKEHSLSVLSNHSIKAETFLPSEFSVFEDCPTEGSNPKDIGTLYHIHSSKWNTADQKVTCQQDTSQKRKQLKDNQEHQNLNSQSLEHQSLNSSSLENQNMNSQSLEHQNLISQTTNQAVLTPQKPVCSLVKPTSVKQGAKENVLLANCAVSVCQQSQKSISSTQPQGPWYEDNANVSLHMLESSAGTNRGSAYDRLQTSSAAPPSSHNVHLHQYADNQTVQRGAQSFYFSDQNQICRSDDRGNPVLSTTLRHKVRHQNPQRPFGQQLNLLTEKRRYTEFFQKISSTVRRCTAPNTTINNDSYQNINDVTIAKYCAVDKMLANDHQPVRATGTQSKGTDISSAVPVGLQQAFQPQDLTLDKTISQLIRENTLQVYNQEMMEAAICLVKFLQHDELSSYIRLNSKKRKQLTKLATMCYISTSEASRWGIRLTKTSFSREPTLRDVFWTGGCAAD